MHYQITSDSAIRHAMTPCVLFSILLGKIAAALREGLLSPTVLASRLVMLVLDEADLLLSYGYEEDLQLLAPQVRQAPGLQLEICITYILVHTVVFVLPAFNVNCISASEFRQADWQAGRTYARTFHLFHIFIPHLRVPSCSVHIPLDYGIQYSHCKA